MPEIAIRSISMGLVEIQGQAAGEDHVLSPVSRAPCFYYKLVSERYEKDEKGHWVRCLDKSKTKVQGVKFYLEDATGKVLVDPLEANLDLPVSGRKRTPRDYQSFDDLTEYCIIKGVRYDVTGTCVENPRPRDENDRNMIVKGTNEKVFLISSKTEKQLESGLRRRALGMILGGAALSVICLALLLAKFGWL